MRRNLWQQLDEFIRCRLSQLLQAKRSGGGFVLVTINDSLRGDRSLEVTDDLLGDLATSVWSQFSGKEGVRSDLPPACTISFAECATVRSVVAAFERILAPAAVESEREKVAF
jgi:hypothetical protein